MAKRKRKMTLFDVINTGQAKGLPGRGRIPTYQPAPELPVQKKIAQLLGRRKPDADDDRPLSAAEQLEQMRRELTPAAPPPPQPRVAAEPRAVPEPARPVPEPAYASTRLIDYREREAETNASRHPSSSRDDSRYGHDEEQDGVTRYTRAPAISVGDRARQLAMGVEPDEPTPRVERKPGKPLGQVAREAWAAVAPPLQRVGRSFRSGAAAGARVGASGLRVGASGLRVGAGQFDGLRRQYGVAALTAGGCVAAAIAIFYVGRLLPSDTSVDPNTRLEGGMAAAAVRPDVLDLSTNRGDRPAAPEATANVANTREDATLTRTAVANATVFGGRRLDQNYVIVQSYATQAEADAAVEVLAKYNIPASVEYNLPRWTNGRPKYSVVSVEGFSTLRDNAKYTKFLTALNRISEREAGNTLPGQLNPSPYKY